MIISINFLVLIKQSQAQWIRTNGPSGGAISDIEFIGNSLSIVTVYGESYFSSDGGDNWIERAGLPPSFAPRLTTRGNELYAATQEGVLVTTDFGLNWDQLSSGIGYAYVRGIAVKDGIVYAFSDEAPNGNVYKLNDATQSWQMIGSYTNSYQTLYNTYVNNDYLFVSVVNGVLRSSDDGVTWQDVSSGLPGGGITNFSSFQDQLFVGTANGLYRSADNGTSWSNAGLEGFKVWSIDISNDTLFAGTSGFGVFRSVDLGVTWENIGIDDKWVYDLKVDNGFVYAGTNFTGMFRTVSYGENWEMINNGFNGMPVNSFSELGDNLIAGAYGGLFISSDMGENWADKGQYFPPADATTEARGCHVVYDVAGDSLNNTIYAGGISAIYQSTDDGETWSIQGQPTIGSGRIEALLVSDFDPDTLKIFAGKGTGSDFAGLFTSMDQGITWTTEDFGFQYTYILDIERKDKLLFAGAGYSTNGGVFRSSDNGISWIKLNNGLPFDLAVEVVFASNQGDLYAACEGGVFRSSDDGDSWAQVWDNGKVTGITSDSQGVLYASSASFTYKGFYKSTDNGNTWQPFNEGLATLPEVVFSITFKNGYLFAGIDRLGVWKRLVDPTVSIDHNKESNRGLRLSQNIPNPFSGVTTLPFSIDMPGIISLEIFDQQGRKIGNTQKHFFEVGDHTIEFDGSKLAPGIYICKIYSNGDIRNQKIVVAR